MPQSDGAFLKKLGLDCCRLCPSCHRLAENRDAENGRDDALRGEMMFVM